MKSYDICIFDIDEYSKNPIVGLVLDKNIKLFEEIGQKKKIQFNWHFIDREKFERLINYYNLSYTKRLYNKGEIFLSELKFFLATQFKNYISFPIDSAVPHKKEEHFKDIFDNNKNYISYDIYNKEAIIQKDTFIKCCDPNSNLIKMILEVYNIYFSNNKFTSFNFALDNDNDEDNDTLFDFNQLKTRISSVSISSLRKVIQGCRHPFKKVNDLIYYGFDIFVGSGERNYGYTINFLPRGFLVLDHWFLQAPESLYITQDFISTFYGLNDIDTKNLINYIMSHLYELNYKVIKVERENVLYHLKNYLNMLYEENGYKKFNVRNAINYEAAGVNIEGFGNFWSDFCYENKDKPEEFIPLPYLNLDDAVQKLCW